MAILKLTRVGDYKLCTSPSTERCKNCPVACASANKVIPIINYQLKAKQPRRPRPKEDVVYSGDAARLLADVPLSRGKR